MVTDSLPLAVQLAVLKELENRVKAVKYELTSGLLDAMDGGDTKAANLSDGTRLGKVSKIDGRMSVFVSNETEFLNWVRENHPTEIVEQVAPAFRDQVLGKVRTTGEIPPGINTAIGSPYVRYVATDDAGEIVSRRWSELMGQVLGIEAT